MNEYRYVDLELRQSEDGRPVIAGTIIRYGDVATFPWGTEEFVAGAFRGNYAPLVYANRMHERSQPLGVLGENLRIVDDEESMRAELELPDTSYGRDTEVEVKLRILRGLSLEFRSIEDTINQEKQHRRISQAYLFGYGVVDRPAYPQSVIARSWQEYRSAHGMVVPVVTLTEQRETRLPVR